MEFIKGRWYKIANNWYAKFETIHNSGRLWRFSEKITIHNDYEKKSDNLNVNKIKDIKIEILTDLSEIQQYLPENHEDKIKKEFVLPKYWHVVVTKKNQKILSNWKNSSGPLLEIGCIVGICDDSGKPEWNQRYHLKSYNYDFGVEITFDQFKQYVLKEPTEWWKTLKKGDIIRCIANKENVSSRNVGQEYEVYYDSGIGGIPTQIYYKRGYCTDNYHEFELVRRANEIVDKPKELTVDDLVEGEFYEYEYTFSDSYSVYSKCLKSKTSKADGIKINTKEYFRNGNFPAHDKVKILTETKIIKQLKASIKQNKFIPESELSKYNNEGDLIMEDYKVGDWVIVDEQFLKSYNGNDKLTWKYLNTPVQIIKKNSHTGVDFVNVDINFNSYGGFNVPLEKIRPATKESIPEYVELLKGWSANDEFVGEIFDTKKDFQEQFKKFAGITKSWNWTFIFKEKVHNQFFKPSTKEAYEAQFKKDSKVESKPNSKELNSVFDFGIEVEPVIEMDFPTKKITVVEFEEQIISDELNFKKVKPIINC